MPNHKPHNKLKLQPLPKRKGKGTKDAIGNLKKPRLSLINKEAMWQLGEALTYGEVTKGVHQWRKGIEVSYLLDAALRHLFQMIDGEDVDVESGCTHGGSIMANISFAIWMLKHRADLDDRYNKPQSRKKKAAHKTLP